MYSARQKTTATKQVANNIQKTALFWALWIRSIKKGASQRLGDLLQSGLAWSPAVMNLSCSRLLRMRRGSLAVHWMSQTLKGILSFGRVRLPSRLQRIKGVQMSATTISQCLTLSNHVLVSEQMLLFAKWDLVVQRGCGRVAGVSWSSKNQCKVTSKIRFLKSGVGHFIDIYCTRISFFWLWTGNSIIKENSQKSMMRHFVGQILQEEIDICQRFCEVMKQFESRIWFVNNVSKFRIC